MVLNILIIKSPEEWAITKQACRDESVVFFLFPLYIYIYIYITCTEENRLPTNKNFIQTQRVSCVCLHQVNDLLSWRNKEVFVTWLVATGITVLIDWLHLCARSISFFRSIVMLLRLICSIIVIVTSLLKSWDLLLWRKCSDSSQLLIPFLIWFLWLLRRRLKAVSLFPTYCNLQIRHSII